MKSLQGANVKIASVKKVHYETTGDYEVEEKEEELRAEQDNELVGEFGEIIYQ